MTTVLIVIGCFLALAVVNMVTFNVTVKRLAGSPKAIEASFKCPYCNIDIVGDRDLDLINHSMCISRSEEEIKQLQLEAAKQPVVSKDTYFVDTRRYTYYSSGSIPPSQKGNQWLNNNLDFEVNEAKIYRNGELIKIVYGKGMNAAEEFAQREITINKHKRGVK